MLRTALQRLEPMLRRLYKSLKQQSIPTLAGDRDVENTWIAENMPEGPGTALDFGPGVNWLGLLAVRRGFDVTSVDLTDVQLPYELPSMKFVRGNILSLPPTAVGGPFDLIINCSTIEHVGLFGRYGTPEYRPEGDVQAMDVLRGVIKPTGLMLMTVPVGRDQVFMPLHRVYGRERLPKLLQGWECRKKEFWTKDMTDRWHRVSEQVALASESSDHYYGLGLFVLNAEA